MQNYVRLVANELSLCKIYATIKGKICKIYDKFNATICVIYGKFNAKNIRSTSKNAKLNMIGGECLKTTLNSAQNYVRSKLLSTEEYVRSTKNSTQQYV